MVPRVTGEDIRDPSTNILELELVFKIYAILTTSGSIVVLFGLYSERNFVKFAATPPIPD